KLAWRNMMLKPILFHVELNVLSILRFFWLSKSASRNDHIVSEIGIRHQN
ncbi:MAG: hypothetical protein ACI9VT_000792, partial [Psychroserpens sp.]